MRPLTLAYLYIRRLRTHPVQELLAGLGVAIGVALTCAVQIANHSVTGSATETVRDLGGQSALQLSARSPRGVREAVVAQARELPAVELATGLLEQRAVLTGNRQSVSVHVVGTKLGSDELGGLLQSRLSIAGLKLGRGIVLPRAVAQALDAVPPGGGGRRAPRVALTVRGRVVSLPVSEAPGRDRVGTFADGRAVVMRRAQLQRIARLPGRVTRVLVQPKLGQARAAQRQLRVLARGRLTLGHPSDEVDLLETATGPGDRASAFFTLIAGIVGWLLAFNAMLLSAPERRRSIAELRLQGYRQSQLAQIALFQAAVLGVAASAVGLLAGDLLARGVLAESADYLAGAFSFGTQTVVPRSALVLSFAAGVLAACLAAAPPLLALRRREAIGAAYRDAAGVGQVLARRTTHWLALAALVALVIALAATSAAAIVAILALTFALLLVLPAALNAGVRVLRTLTQRAGRMTMAALGLLMLQATTVRSLALAATAALAVFGSVAVGSAREDLLRGISHFSEHYAGSADIWVVHPDDNQATKDFPADDLRQRLARLPQLSAVRPYRGGFLDVAGRRAWLIARAGDTREPVPSSEIVTGSTARIASRLRAGGWLTLSEQLAAALATRPGGSVTLPTPRGPARYRVAATTTNFGWSSGAIVLSAADYRRDWGSTDLTALELDLRAGAAPGAAVAAVRRELGPGSGLEVMTAAQRISEANASARQGLERLGQIAALLIVGAALAMAAAISASIWQRRPVLAALRLQGLRPAQLWRALLAEDGAILLAGCLGGAIAGIYGQLLIDRYLQHTTGFAAPFTLVAGPALEALALLIALVFAGLALPAYIATRAPAQLGLREEGS